MMDLPLDHLVWATSDLREAVDQLGQALGVTPVPGGVHPGWGTRNALLGLGPARYLEIVASDPDQPDPPTPRIFGIDTLPGSRLVTWAASAADLEAKVLAAAELGVDLGAPRPMSRSRADGSELRWQLTDPRADRAGGVIPFLIDWGGSEHPAASLPAVVLTDFRLGHPSPAEVRRVLADLAISIEVESAPRPTLRAVLEGPGGSMTLDSLGVVL